MGVGIQVKGFRSGLFILKNFNELMRLFIVKSKFKDGVERKRRLLLMVDLIS